MPTAATLGTWLEAAFAWLIGSTGVLILGTFTLLAGLLLLTGASVGAIVRRSQGAVQSVRRRATAARGAGARRGHPARAARGPARPSWTASTTTRTSRRQTVEALERAPSRRGGRTRSRRSSIRRRSRARHIAYPTARCSVRRRPPEGIGRDERAYRRDACHGARELRGRRDRRRGDLRPARDPVRASARAGYESREGGRAEGRSLVRARHHGDPHPRADPRASRPLAWKSRTPRPNLVTLGDVFDDLPQAASPLSRLARQGHLGQRRLDRPLAHAAHPHRRHDGLGQVGLHQHDPHVDPPPCEPGRGADDPRRPEADRARLLRVDPAPADAGRLQPEAGRRRAHERRRARWSGATSACRSSAPAACRR